MEIYNFNRKNNGITLIALVVSIIILLILAGISIGMLSGENGILKKASEAKEKTTLAQDKENSTLGIYEDYINEYTSGLPKTEVTQPYLPDSSFKYIYGNLNSGLVIQDSNQNEYVWVEVPMSIYTNSNYNSQGTPTSANDFPKINSCLKSYTKDYASSEYNDTNPDYNKLYENMLTSIYTHGGFWIGRYEAGTSDNKSRTSYSETTITDRAVTKQNMYPYNYVTRKEAQLLSNRMSYKNSTSSLMFGIQWDLTLKFIEEKTVENSTETDKDAVRATIKNILTQKGKEIGNYYDNLWNITNSQAKYLIFSEKIFNNCPKSKEAISAILLTTGSSENFSLMNIYDLAGNVWEWTLEKTFEDRYPCARRGGGFVSDGSTLSASNRFNGITSDSYGNVGFRISLF